MKNSDQPEIISFSSAVIVQNIIELRKAIQGVRRRTDIEDIHDLRVASRRVRVALQTFAKFLPTKKVRVWEKAIRKLTKAFGDARDLDVQISLIKSFYQQENNLINRPGIRRLLLRLHQRRKRLQQKLKDTLDMLHKNSILQSMLAYLEPLALNNQIKPKDNTNLFQLAFDAIHQRLEEFLFYEIFIPYPERIKEMHLMRIAAKRLRYTIEIFASLYEKKLDAIIETMRCAQTALGEIRDCDVWLMYLPNFLEKEKDKVVSYFGNPRPYKRLIPGIEALQSNRQNARNILYDSFIQNWKKWHQAEVWGNLRQIIFEPILFISKDQVQPANSTNQLHPNSPPPAD